MFREDNVFTGVCLPVHEWGSHMTITQDAVDLTVQGPSLPNMGHGDPLVPLKIWDPLILTSGGHNCRSTSTDICWRPKQLGYYCYYYQSPTVLNFAINESASSMVEHFLRRITGQDF